MSKAGKRPKDVNHLAHHLVELSTGLQSPPTLFNISEYMSKIGHKGGKIGGKRRLKTLTAEERRRIARNAAKARWKKYRHSEA
jgi:adenylate kinase